MVTINGGVVLFVVPRHADTATNMLLAQVECASEVTGIEFNSQLKQVATSHHSFIQEATALTEKRHVIKCKNFSKKLMKIRT